MPIDCKNASVRALPWMRQYVFALLATLVISCGGTDADVETAAGLTLVHDGDLIRIPDTSPLRASLVVGAVETKALTRVVAAPGVVQADPTRLAKVAPPASGKIQQVFVKLGQTVKQGDPLFSLDSPDVDQAIADRARAESALLLAKKNLDRQKDFLDHGIAAQQDVETAEAAYTQAAAESARTTARLNGLGYRGENKGDPSILIIHAPAAGSVIELVASPGTYVNDVAAALVTVADISVVVVNAQLPERDLAYVKPGVTAKLEFAAFPNAAMTGAVSSVSDVIAADTRRASVLIPLDNADKHLKPGMFAAIKFEEEEVPRVVVPASALLQSGGENVVYVETSPWVFSPRNVAVDYQQDELAIISQGLDGTERVVIKGGVIIHGQ